MRREILHHPLDNIDAVRADRPARLPVVLTPQETKSVEIVFVSQRFLLPKPLQVRCQSRRLLA
jgi:hypothetical protein